MIKKVNVKEASTLWIICMFIPFVNGFVLMGRAAKIYNKPMKYIGLSCSLGTVIFPAISLAFTEFDAVVAILFVILPLAAYIGCIVAALVMKNEYAYKKGVMDYANQYHVVYNDFETAEEGVFKFLYKNGAETYAEELQYAAESEKPSKSVKKEAENNFIKKKKASKGDVFSKFKNEKTSGNSQPVNFKSEDPRREKAGAAEESANPQDETTDVPETSANPQEETTDATETSANPQDETTDATETSANPQDETTDATEMSANPQDETTDATETSASPQDETTDVPETGDNSQEEIDSSPEDKADNILNDILNDIDEN